MKKKKRERKTCIGCKREDQQGRVCMNVCIRHRGLADHYESDGEDEALPGLPARIEVFKVEDLSDPNGIGQLVRAINALIDYLKAREVGK